MRSRSHRRLRRQVRGFTLVELLLVTAILGVVITAIGACLAGGIRAWEACRTFNTVESEAMYGLRILHRDLMNAVPLYAVPFEGNSRNMSFLVRLPSASDEGTGLSRVRYTFDRAEDALVRSVWPFPGSERVDGAGEERLVGNVSWLAFSYADASGTSPAGNSWESKTNYPSVVSIELDLDVGGKEVTFQETVCAARNDGLKAAEETP